LALELEQVFRDKAKLKQKGGQGGVLLPLISAEANQVIQYKGSSLPQISAEVKPIEKRH
jgi:hypothetical protein